MIAELKGYYKNGVIKIDDDNVKLEDGPVNVIVTQNKKSLSERLRKYKGAIKIYGSTQAVQEYIKDCRSGELQ